MATTIQIDKKTLILLKKMKEELNVSSYNEAIKKLVVKQSKQQSMAGSLKKYMKGNLNEILNNLRDKNDRL